MKEYEVLASVPRRQTDTPGPKMAISRAELECYPCAVRPVQVLSANPTATVYLTSSLEMQPGAPLILNYHGGGFALSRGDRDELFCRRLACAFHCMVVDVDYALAPEHPFPAAVDQALAVALWAKGQAAAWGCDPGKVMLVGQSAGGNLVANICMAESEQAVLHPLCAVIAYAPLDLRTDPAQKPCPSRDVPVERARTYNSRYCTLEQSGDPRVSPLFAPLHLLSGFPPTLVSTAGDDRLAGEGKDFARNLARAGVPATCKRFLRCVHGFLVNRMDAWEDGIELLHGYLRSVLAGRE